MTTPLVNSSDRTVSSRVFTDPAVFALEQATVFSRSWLYLGHRSQFSGAGDFIQTYAGTIPLLLCLDDEGRFHAFANVCSHRGGRICQVEYGQARKFRLPVPQLDVRQSRRPRSCPATRRGGIRQIEVASLPGRPGRDVPGPDLRHLLSGNRRAGGLPRRHEVVSRPPAEQQQRRDGSLRRNASLRDPLQLEVPGRAVRLRQLAFPGCARQHVQAGPAQRGPEPRGQLSCLDGFRAHADLRGARRRSCRAPSPPTSTSCWRRSRSRRCKGGCCDAPS